MKLVSCHPGFSKAANESFPESVSKGGLSTSMNDNSGTLLIGCLSFPILIIVVLLHK